MSSVCESELVKSEMVVVRREGKNVRPSTVNFFLVFTGVHFLLPAPKRSKRGALFFALLLLFFFFPRCLEERKGEKEGPGVPFLTRSADTSIHFFLLPRFPALINSAALECAAGKGCKEVFAAAMLR